LSAVQAMGDSSAEAETYEPNWMARRVGAQSVEQAGQAAAGAAQEAARIEALQQRAVGAQEEASIARLVAEKEAEKERVAVNLAVEAAKMEAALKKARTEAVRLEAERVASADRVAQMEAEAIMNAQATLAPPPAPEPTPAPLFGMAMQQLKDDVTGLFDPKPPSAVGTAVGGGGGGAAALSPAQSSDRMSVKMMMQTTSVEAVKVINEAKRWPSVARMKAEADMAMEERSYVRQYESKMAEQVERTAREIEMQREGWFPAERFLKWVVNGVRRG